MLKVSDLAAYFPPPYNRKLRSCADSLRSLVEEVRLKNGANRKLLQYYMRWVNNALNLLTDIFDEQPFIKNRESGWKTAVIAATVEESSAAASDLGQISDLFNKPSKKGIRRGEHYLRHVQRCQNRFDHPAKSD